MAQSDGRSASTARTAFASRPVTAGLRDRGPTSDAERIENYRAVIGLEPEELSKGVSSRGAYLSYMLIEKPLDIQGGGVRHKGGPVLAASNSNPGVVCLTGWIAGAKDIAGPCRDAANEPLMR